MVGINVCVQKELLLAESRRMCPDADGPLVSGVEYSFTLWEYMWLIY